MVGPNTKHTWREIVDLTCSRHLFTSTAVVQSEMFLVQDLFNLHMRATFNALLSNRSTMVESNPTILSVPAHGDNTVPEDERLVTKLQI